jgi:hypothetical protein
MVNKWEELTLIKYSQCLWEEKEDLVDSEVKEQEEDQHLKHLRIKEIKIVSSKDSLDLTDSVSKDSETKILFNNQFDIYFN